MIAKLAWILCYIVALCANDVDVTLRIATTSASSKLEANWKDTGCTVQTERQDVTCTPKDDGSDLGQVPATYASAVVNCKNMDTSAYDSLLFEPSPFCAMFSFTQHMEKGDKVRFLVNRMEIFPGSIANITCVLYTQTISKAKLAGFEIPQTFGITGKKGEDETFLDIWDMPFVFVRAANLAEKEADKCLELLNREFAWGFGLRKSHRNVHELYFTTQRHSPNFHRVGFQINRSNVTVTKTVRDVELKDLGPKVTQAGCSTASGDFAHLVELKTFEAPAVQDQVEKHEEELEISVDATGLPKGTKELDITLEYRFRPLPRRVQLKLPVVGPIIDDRPTEKPTEEKKSGGSAGLLAFLLTSIAGAVAAVAFFFYRRHDRIQAHEREVFAPG
eukprot:Skav219534  [mRNA]  locus=scaffold30:789954:791123:- [translate_table: standard]